MKSLRVLFLPILLAACTHNATHPQAANSVEDRLRAAETAGVAAGCFETRAAFDVGSATTRMMVADVDKCEQKLLSIVTKEERGVPYKDDLAQSSNQEFSETLQASGVAVFKELQARAQKNGATKFAGTATSAFRGARNASAYVTRVKEEARVSLFIIEQTTEAEMGFLAAVNEPSVIADKVVVWDIGGGSMQFSARENAQMVTSLVEMGSVGFKNEVLRKIKPKADLATSPNPIGEKNLHRILSMAKEHALRNTTLQIRELLKSRTVLGIGGVHASSILKQTGQSNEYTPKQLMQALKERANFDDTKVGGAYAATDVTNLALVLGYMQALQIKSVRAINLNLTNGTILYPRFWN